MTQEKLLEEIRQRVEKATKGPWRVANWNTIFGYEEELEESIDALCIESGNGDSEDPIVRNRDDVSEQVFGFEDAPFAYENFWNDARFVTKARTDTPILLNIIQEMRKALEFYAELKNLLGPNIPFGERARQALNFTGKGE